MTRSSQSQHGIENARAQEFDRGPSTAFAPRSVSRHYREGPLAEAESFPPRSPPRLNNSGYDGQQHQHFYFHQPLPHPHSRQLAPDNQGYYAAYNYSHRPIPPPPMHHHHHLPPPPGSEIPYAHRYAPDADLSRSQQCPTAAQATSRGIDEHRHHGKNNWVTHTYDESGPVPNSSAPAPTPPTIRLAPSSHSPSWEETQNYSTSAEQTSRPETSSTLLSAAKAIDSSVAATVAPSNDKLIQNLKSDESHGSSILCTCKKSKCLKLYCQCFASSVMCNPSCRCNSCMNTPQHEKARKQAIRTTLTRNPGAFKTKFILAPEGDPLVNNKYLKERLGIFNGLPRTPRPSAVGGGGVAHKVGCKCRKSACLKKYCGMYQLSMFDGMIFYQSLTRLVVRFHFIFVTHKSAFMPRQSVVPTVVASIVKTNQLQWYLLQGNPPGKLCMGTILWCWMLPKIWYVFRVNKFHPPINLTLLLGGANYRPFSKDTSHSILLLILCLLQELDLVVSCLHQRNPTFQMSTGQPVLRARNILVRMWVLPLTRTAPREWL